MIAHAHALASAFALLLLSPTAAAAATGPGGAGVPERPEVVSVACATGEPWACRPGMSLLVTGSGLDSVEALVLLGRRGPGDDQRVPAVSVSPTTLSVVLPRPLRPGRIKLVGRAGTAMPTRPLGVLTTPAPAPVDPEAGSAVLEPGEALYAGSRKRAVFAVNLTAPAPIEAFAVDTGAVVRTWRLPAGPGVVRWDGTVDGLPVPDGRYAFRVAGDETARAASATTDPIVIHDAVFPIRGAHDLGRSPTSNFGGGRGHGGQDLFAACGTPLVAVRPGRIVLERFQARAGNYVVLQDAGGQSYVYMHMRDRSLVAKNGRVKAGQTIGYVGLTGRTSGCHLHFELWTAPGWYKGGKAIDPLPELARWDAFR